MLWVYSEKVKDHFLNPRNILKEEDNFKEDGSGTVGNPVCGDMIVMKIKVDKKKETITDCKWRTYGCASAIASTSILSEMIIGMKLKDAYNIKPQDIVDKLDGLPAHKIHCSVLGDKALRKAIVDYYQRNKKELPENFVIRKDIVCKCLDITQSEIELEVIENNVKTFEELQKHTKIATSCGKCEQEARKFLAKLLKKKHV